MEEKLHQLDRSFIPVFIGFQNVSNIQGGAGFRNHPQYVLLVGCIHHIYGIYQASYSIVYCNVLYLNI